MKRVVSICLCVVIAAGCTVTKDGFGVAHRPPDANKVAQVKEQLQQNADTAAAASPASDPPQKKGPPGILVIGTTGPLRTIEDKDRGSFYAAYLNASQLWHPGQPPAMDAVRFQDKLAGWASVQISGIPGIASIRLKVLVPASIAREARFASAAGSFLFGTTGDLVAAKGNGDGLLWVERILCRDDSNYHACAKAYQKGIFDENTGQELDRDRKPKPDGDLVNVSNFTKIMAR
jgi:hypothetical protein